MSNLSLFNQFGKEIFNFSQKFTNHLSKPQQGNFREMIRGMLFQKEIFLTEIGKVNSNEITNRKNTERLSNTLSKIDALAFTHIHINSKSQMFKNEPVLILSDGGDIQKPYANSSRVSGMQNVCRNVDGSNGHKTGIGYLTQSLMAYGTTSGRLMPLAQHLYSTEDEDFKSQWYEHRKVFTKLDYFIHCSNKDRIIVEDRGCDDEKRFVFFRKELDASFVTRVCVGQKSRKLIIKDDDNLIQTSIRDIAQRLQEKATDEKIWRNKKIKKTLVSKVSFQEIYLPDHLDMTLYVIFVYSDEYDQPLVVLTDLITENTDQAWKHFFYYKKRWEVENFYRATKQQFSAEKFLIRDYQKIQALAFMVMIAYALLLTLKEKLNEILQMFYVVFTEFCRKEQRENNHHLDLLAFLRDYFKYIPQDHSYRFWSLKISRYRYHSNKDQLILFNLNKNW